MSVIPYITSNIPVYRFYLTYQTITYEVFPLNFLETQVVDEQEAGQVFYRKKFAGVLLFGTKGKVFDVSGVEQDRADDFTLLWSIASIDPCARLDLTITKTVGGVIYDYFEGYFSTTDGTIDIDKCTFEVSPLTDDDYTDILDSQDIQTNIFDIATIVTTICDLNHLGTGVPVSFTRNRWLYHSTEVNLLETLANVVKPGVNVSSTFFSAAINPATLDTNLLTLLTISQKSDIKFPTSSDPAHGETGLISWKELMDILWAMFQVKWDYDPMIDTINVEHISFFNQDDGIDLRTQLSTQSTNRYSYKKESMPKYENFKFMESSEPNFIGKNIWYDSYCVNTDPTSNSKETAISVTTDVEYIINDVVVTGGDNIDNDGFVIFCNYLLGGSYYVRMNYGKFDGSAHRNMDLSWANLHDLYYRHERVLIEGYMNDVLTDFWTGQKNILQECSAILCVDDDYHAEDLITTELGMTYLGGVKASVERGELSPKGVMKFNLKYPPVPNAFTGVPNLMAGMAFVGVQDNTEADPPEDDLYYGHLFLNNPAPVGGITIRYRVHEYDAGSVLLCTTAWDTFTIAAGQWYAYLVNDLCSPLASLGCIVFEFEYAAADIDVFVATYISTDTGSGYACGTPFIYTVI
jgi:hypothetical protein